MKITIASLLMSMAMSASAQSASMDEKLSSLGFKPVPTCRQEHHRVFARAFGSGCQGDAQAVAQGTCGLIVVEERVEQGMFIVALELRQLYGDPIPERLKRQYHYSHDTLERARAGFMQGSGELEYVSMVVRAASRYFGDSSWNGYDNLPECSGRR